MNFKTTALLIALAAAVVAYFYFFESKKPSSFDLEKARLENLAQEGTPVLPGAPEPGTIDAVDVEIKSAKLELARQGAEWTQTKPVRFPLNQWSVQGLVEQGLGLRYTRKFTPGQKETPTKAEIGLDPALATITLKTTGAKPFSATVRVGQTTVGGRAYVMVDGQPDVFVVSDGLYKGLLTQKPEEWRSRTLRNIPAFRENRAELITLSRRSQPDIELARRDREWALGGQSTGRVDPKSVETVLSGLMTLHIDKFVSDGGEDLGLYGLDKPSLSVTLRSTLAPVTSETALPASQPSTQPTTSAPKTLTQTLRIGSPDPGGAFYFAAWSEGDEKPQVVFTILKSDRDRFDKSVNDFRDPRLTPLAITEIKELTLERGSEVLKLERDSAGNWSFAAPAPDFKADTDAVSSLLDDTLMITRADGFVANAKPTGQPLATVRLAAAARPEPDVIRVFSGADAQGGKVGSDEHYLVLRNNETTGMLVPQIRLAKLFQPAVTLRDRVLFATSPSELTKIQLKRGGATGGSAEVVLDRAPAASQPATAPAKASSPPPSAWVLPGNQKVDAASLDSLLVAVAPFRVEAWTTESKPTPADEKSVIEIHLTQADGKTFAARLYPESRLGTIEGVKAFFRVSATSAEAIRGELRDRTIVGLEVDDLKHLSVTEPKSEAALVVDRDDFGGFNNPEGKSVSQANAGAMFDALAALRAEHYIDAPALAPDAPARRMVLQSKSGKTVKLDLPIGPGLDRTVHATLPDGSARWFSVPEDVAKKLRADLLAPAKDSPMQMPQP